MSTDQQYWKYRGTRGIPPTAVVDFYLIHGVEVLAHCVFLNSTTADQFTVNLLTSLEKSGDLKSNVLI